MDDSRHAMRPVTTPRPRGAPRLDAFSLKLNRRLTLFQRGAPELWLLIEADPAALTFCERPGYAQLGGQCRLADFWVRYVDREELVILSDSLSETSPHAARPTDHLDDIAHPIGDINRPGGRAGLDRQLAAHVALSGRGTRVGVAVTAASSRNLRDDTAYLA
ncbi:hypothetical protein [Burkholderia stagnalis]|uniref:hypothetical protein n=1 Tax=Burkholderia stagnalis TaxID=1503054 RepID=UPI001F495DE3|nr:hypothetical protein [Burkholderia stagnalis]